MFQREAVEKLHGDEGLAVVLADVVDRADVRMVQGGRRLGFALKTGERLRVAGNFFREEFQGDETMQAGVFGFVNHAHAAAAEFFHDAVVRNGLVNHRELRRLRVASSYGGGIW